MRHTVLLYNPISTSPGKQRLPLSLLAIAAVIVADYDVEFIDGNLIDDPAQHIIERAKATNAKLLACTVMPGPQLRQAVPDCKKIKAECPDLTILWGGYFPSNHSEVVVRSGFVDYAIQGQGEAPFRQFVDTLHKGGSLDDIPSLVYEKDGEVIINNRAPFIQIDNLPRYPYEKLDMQTLSRHKLSRLQSPLTQQQLGMSLLLQLLCHCPPRTKTMDCRKCRTCCRYYA